MRTRTSCPPRELLLYTCNSRAAETATSRTLPHSCRARESIPAASKRTPQRTTCGIMPQACCETEGCSGAGLARRQQRHAAAPGSSPTTHLASVGALARNEWRANVHCKLPLSRQHVYACIYANGEGMQGRMVVVRGVEGVGGGKTSRDARGGG